MNEFIEKNKGLLRFCYIAARIIGWALLVFPVILVIRSLLTGTGAFGDLLSWPSYIEKRLMYREAFPLADGQADLLSLVIRFVLPGLLMLGLAQFITYLSVKNYRPGWTLRCGEGILYLYAILITGQAIWNSVLGPGLRANIIYHLDGLRAGIHHVGLMVILASMLITAAKVVILIGLGQIIARVMPVIEESKTLV